MTVHRGGVHAEGLDPGSLELGHLIAHGGELTVSAGSVVPGVEDQRYVRALEDIGQSVALPVRGLGLEPRRLAADGQEIAHRFTPPRDAAARRFCSTTPA